MILKADKTTVLNSVKVNEYFLTEHNTRNIAMPSASMEGNILGVTIHNTDWITTAAGYDYDAVQNKVNEMLR